MNSLNLLKDFLKKEILSLENLKDDIIQNEIKNCLNKLEEYVRKNYSITEDNICGIENVLIKRIFINLYDINQKNSTTLSNELRKFKYSTGAKEREVLKEYLDYREEDILKELEFYNSEIKGIIQFFIENNNIFEEIQYEAAKNMFVEQILEQKDKLSPTKLNDKIYDRILAIYSAFIQHNELKKKENILAIFNENKNEILDILGENFAQEFYNKLVKINKIDTRKKIASVFSREFLKIRQRKYQEDNPSLKITSNSDWEKLESLLIEDYECIYFKITQEFYLKYNNYDKFMNLLLNTLKELYRVLKNHRLLIIKIENIYVDGKNIKWDIYSKLSIYGENFRKEKLGSYYNPSQLFIDYLKQRYPNTIIEKDIENSINLAYKHNDSSILRDILVELYTEKNIEELIKVFENYKEAYLGFSYIDTFI